MRTILNPFKIIIAWIILCIIVGLFVLLFSSSNKSGGDKSILTSFAYFLLTIVDGVILLSIITPFFYKNWFKKYWYINTIVLILGLIAVLPLVNGVVWNNYDILEESSKVGNDMIDIKKEYYSKNNKQLRSESYWRNGKKDSIWIIYNKNGEIIKKDSYRNNYLVK